MHFLLITSLNPLVLYTASLTDIKIRLPDSLVYACYLGIIINSILFLSQKYLSLDNKLYDYLFIMCESFTFSLGHYTSSCLRELALRSFTFSYICDSGNSSFLILMGVCWLVKRAYINLKYTLGSSML